MKCCFIGHRDCKGIQKLIECEINKLINLGVDEFYSGNMGNFDKMCETAAKNYGGKIIFIPYNIARVKETDKLWYDAIICPFENKPYSKYDIPIRNRWMVDNCDICLSYVYREGGASKTLNYAIQKHKLIIHL